MRDGDVDDRLDRRFLYALFALAAVAHLLLATRNWHWGFLIGHEFRQAQTAIISYYIDLQNNFSVHYETPVLGKPWEVPLEFPLYEWAVVWLSRATGWPHFEAARTISLTSVYLAMPAIALLLGRAGLSRPRQLLVLALYLATPVYLFYGRAFLMDTTAMMFSAWFLAAFVETMERRRWAWLVLCAVTGTAAGLIKSLTFFVWLFPAALYGAWSFWSDLRSRRGWDGVVRTVMWSTGAVILPVLAVTWWVKFTDAIKADHPSGYIFTSRGLTRGNFGMYDLSVRFSKHVWAALLDCWSMALAHPWAIALILLAGLAVLRGFRARILGAFGLFIAAQMAFPNAYAFQDYYFTACAVFAVAAIGFAMNGVFSAPLPRWCRWVLVLLPIAAFYAAYTKTYYRMQAVKSHGGTGLTIALRDYLPKNSVLIVDGADWSAIIPYNSRHRALMIRNGLDADAAYMRRALDDISDENVSALVMIGETRKKQELIRRIVERFDLDREPTFRYGETDVYVSYLHRPEVIDRLQRFALPEGVSVDPQRINRPTPNDAPHAIAPGPSSRVFPMIHPAPYQYWFKFGYELWNVDEHQVLNAHPDTTVWVTPPPGAREVVWEFGLRAETYTEHDTDGADFILEAHETGHAPRVLFSRFLDPVHRPADRGLQRQVVPLSLRPGESLLFRTAPHGAYNFDWCYWRSIDVR